MVYPFNRILPSVKNDFMDLYEFIMEIELPYIKKKREVYSTCMAFFRLRKCVYVRVHVHRRKSKCVALTTQTVVFSSG